MTQNCSLFPGNKTEEVFLPKYIYTCASYQFKDSLKNVNAHQETEPHELLWNAPSGQEGKQKKSKPVAQTRRRLTKLQSGFFATCCRILDKLLKSPFSQTGLTIVPTLGLFPKLIREIRGKIISTDLAQGSSQEY